MYVTEMQAPYYRANKENWNFVLSPREADGFTGASQKFGYYTEYYLYKISTLTRTLQNNVNSVCVCACFSLSLSLSLSPSPSPSLPLPLPLSHLPPPSYPRHSIISLAITL
jgi:hypothetical protein